LDLGGSKGGAKMRIKQMMTENPITVDPNTSVLDAQKIMKEKKVRRLPVVERGKLVGLVTKTEILDAMITMGRDLTDILARKKVKEMMRENPITVTPDTPFEDALRIGQEKRVGSFPVVKDGKLIGIATESDIVRFLIHTLGIHEEGSRVTIVGSKEQWGWLEKVISIADQHKVVILSMIVLPRPKEGDWLVAFRLNTKDPKAIIQDLKKEGYNVTWAVAPVKAEW
jgi:acetoin utilization protein AcuB